MQRTNFFKLTIVILVIMILSACRQNPATSDWVNFTIEEAPGFDIQFQVPPDWETNVTLPMEIAVGQWKVILTPPRCSSGQGVEYEEDCITLTAYIKGEAEFEEDEVLTLVSDNIPISAEERAESILMGQNNFDVNGLNLQRFNHKIYSSAGEMQMSIIYFQTDSAYYLIMANFPYDERDAETAQEFQAMLESIKVLD
ncbi:MAG: hypothetical protein SVP52_00565 [Chloroflexota bacterium]|nr:hypothetical protein [Chloroflexota bacterium]